MNKRIGFIGCGNMGKSMVGALVGSGEIPVSDIIVSTKTDTSLNEIKNKWKIQTTLSNKEVVDNSDLIFLAVSPTQYETVITEIKDHVLEHHIIITIAAGIDLKQIRNWFDKDVKIVKSMPNTPVLVNEGMSALCSNEWINEADMKRVCKIFSMFGQYEILEEKDFHAFIALCGSSPAYIFVLIEAMADAAVKLGLPRLKAYKMAEQTILGSAKLALETGSHPGILKDMVCSPGGSTIEAIIELEKQGFRHAIISSMEACADKSRKMQADNV